MVNLALSNGQVVSTTLANLQSIAQPQNLMNTPASNGRVIFFYFINYNYCTEKKNVNLGQKFLFMRKNVNLHGKNVNLYENINFARKNCKLNTRKNFYIEKGVMLNLVPKKCKLNMKKFYFIRKNVNDLSNDYNQ